MMMKARQFSYALPKDIEFDDIVKGLQKHYSVLEDQPIKRSEQYLDTFDWCLYQNKMVIQRIGGHYLLSAFDGKVLSEARGTQKKNLFWWDLPSGALQESLRSVTDIRALMPLLQVQKTIRRIRLLNKDEKTVLQLSLEWGYAETDGIQKGELVPVVSGREIRGYQRPFDRVTEVLIKAGLDEIPAEDPPFLRALDAVDRKPNDYCSKFSIALDHDYRVHEAVSAICLQLLGGMKINLPGVIQDVDSEFLHDFRIAVRRTRSLISQLKKVLPTEKIAYFNNEFKWLGLITGPVRDLDVYLLKKEEFHDMLPEQLHPGLMAFLESLKHMRKKDLRAMQRELRSERIEKLFSDWELFLTSSPGESWTGAEKYCKKVAIKVINKRFQHLLKDGLQIDDTTPDQALHRLRIQGKKLRYLIEFFRSFFADNEVKIFLKQMRKLQNNLGDFNDLSVQQAMLCHYQEGLTGRSKRTVMVASALGGLISHLSDDHRRVRRKFKKAFNNFSSPDNIALFKNTFQ